MGSLEGDTVRVLLWGGLLLRIGSGDCSMLTYHNLAGEP